MVRTTWVGSELVHFGKFGSSEWKSVSAGWPPTLTLSCKLQAAIGWIFTHRHMYYYFSAMSLILFYRPSGDGRLSRPRHCSKYAACAQSCVSQWFFVKNTETYPQCEFDHATSHVAAKHSTTRPPLPVLIIIHGIIIRTRVATSEWRTGADSVQAGRSYIQTHPRNGTDLSVRWTPPARGSRDQNPPTIGADHITAGPQYTAVDCRRPSSSCRRCPHLERPAAPRHVRIISACFPKPSEDSPLPAFFPFTFVQCPRNDSCHYWHSNRSFTY